REERGMNLEEEIHQRIRLTSEAELHPRNGGDHIEEVENDHEGEDGGEDAVGRSRTASRRGRSANVHHSIHSSISSFNGSTSARSEREHFGTRGKPGGS